jgi:LPXTG-site transpeptidase (sortase) family protein
MLRNWNLQRTNNVLLTLIILVNLYVVAAPFVPAVIFWYKAHHTNTQATLNHLLTPSTAKSTTTSKSPAAPVQNSLVVPAMLLNTPILEGPVWKEYTTLNQGVWRWPDGSTPDKGGNTILIGHRFTYTDPRGIFYELNKVVVGDQIGVFWSGKEYLYTTANVSTVSPSNTTILNQTTQPELTLYTCTPTWNPRYRLVVVANLTSIRSMPSS